MSKLVIEINGESRKAVVTKDAEASVICSLKKESNESYSVVLKGKVEWPTKFYNIGRDLTDRVIEVDEEEAMRRKSGRSANSDGSSAVKSTLSAKNVAKRLMDAKATLVEEGLVSDEEAEMLEKLIDKLVANQEQLAQKAKIEKLRAEIAKLEAEAAAFESQNEEQAIEEPAKRSKKAKKAE